MGGKIAGKAAYVAPFLVGDELGGEEAGDDQVIEVASEVEDAGVEVGAVVAHLPAGALDPTFGAGGL